MDTQHMSLLKVGADPEVFWLKNGIPQSAEGLVGGTKAAPRPIPKGKPGFAVQEDNVSCEFNIPPAEGSEEFNKNIAFVLKYINALAKKNKCVVTFSPDLDFPIEQVSTPHARRMGCDPDYSVWTMEENPRPRPPEQMRTAAGHVHISWTGEISQETQVLVGRASDVWLGCAQIVSTEKNRRRELYGKAGCIRPKPFGIEYRTLDCSWISSPQARKQVFHNIEQMFDEIRKNNNLLNLINMWGDHIQQAINKHDKDVALRILDSFNVTPLPIPA